MAGDNEVEIVVRAEDKTAVGFASARRGAKSLEDSVGGLDKVFAKAGDGFLQKLFGGSGPASALDFSGIKQQLIPVLGGLVASAAPLIAGGISAAVVGGIGAGGILGGVYAASKDPRVRGAFGELMSGLTPEKFGAESFVQPTIDAIGILKQTLAGTDIAGVLGKGSSGVPVFAKGISDFATNLLPGLDAAMSKSSQYAQIFASGFGDIGDALSDAITDMAEGEGAMDALQVILSGTADTIRVTGAALSWLANGFGMMADAAVPLANVANKLWGWLPGIGAAIRMGGDNAAEASGEYGDLSKSFTKIDQATRAVNQGLDPFNSYLKDAQSNAEALNVTLQDLFGSQMSVDQASLAWEASLDRLSGAVKENGKSLDITTEKGRAVNSALLDGVEAAMRQRDAMIKNGEGTQAANAKYQAAIDKLYALAAALGISKEGLDRIVGQYDITVITTYKSVGTKPNFNPGSSSYASQEVYGHSYGGVTGAETGGSRGGWTMVGEHGRELVKLPFGSSVQTNGATEAMMGAGGNSQRVELVIESSGSSIDNLALEVIRKIVKVRGGNAQTVFGR